MLHHSCDGGAFYFHGSGGTKFLTTKTPHALAPFDVRAPFFYYDRICGASFNAVPAFRTAFGDYGLGSKDHIKGFFEQSLDRRILGIIEEPAGCGSGPGKVAEDVFPCSF